MGHLGLVGGRGGGGRGRSGGRGGPVTGLADRGMSKVPLRARALDAAKPMPVYAPEELPDLDDYAACNRTLSALPTGVDKEEEMVTRLFPFASLSWPRPALLPTPPSPPSPPANRYPAPPPLPFPPRFPAPPFTTHRHPSIIDRTPSQSYQPNSNGTSRDAQRQQMRPLGFRPGWSAVEGGREGGGGIIWRGWGLSKGS